MSTSLDIEKQGPPQSLSLQKQRCPSGYGSTFAHSGMRNLVGGEPAMFLPSLEAENGAPKVNGWPGHAHVFGPRGRRIDGWPWRGT